MTIRRSPYHPNGLQGKQDSSEEERELLDRSECSLPLQTDRLPEDVVGDDGEGNDRRAIGDHAEGRQILQISHLCVNRISPVRKSERNAADNANYPIDQYQRQKNDHHVHADIGLSAEEVIDDGFDVRSYKNNVNAACSQLIHEEEDVCNVTAKRMKF